MQKEKLFKKIKHTALIDTSGTEEYDSAKIWIDIKRKRNKSMWLWCPYVAASVLLLTGIFFYVSKIKEVETSVMAESGRMKSPSAGLSKNSSGHPVDVIQSNGITKVNKKKNKPSLNPIEQPTNWTSLPTSVYLSIHTLAIADSAFAEVNVPTMADTTIAKNDYSQSPSEKVLVADISIPEEKTDGYPALRQIFDQARKERQTRKMRIQFNRGIMKPGLWSFVHHSFIQVPTINTLGMPQKMTDLTR